MYEDAIRCFISVRRDESITIDVAKQPHIQAHSAIYFWHDDGPSVRSINPVKERNTPEVRKGLSYTINDLPSDLRDPQDTSE